MATQGIASIGIDVAVDETSLNYVTEIGDIGGAPSNLDATCLKDKIKKYVPGVQDVESWECTYLFDNGDTASDYRVLKALQDAGEIVSVVVKLPNDAAGNSYTTFASTGYINTYISGAGVDALIEAKLVVSLQSDWTVTNPTPTGGS